MNKPKNRLRRMDSRFIEEIESIREMIKEQGIHTHISDTEITGLIPKHNSWVKFMKPEIVKRILMARSKSE